MVNRNTRGRKLDEFAFFTDSSFKQKLSILAEKAEPEDWDYQYSDTGYGDIETLPSDNQDKQDKEFPILKNYLQYTFQRLDEENKVVYDTRDENKAEYACFNTGLISRTSAQPLIGLFHVNENYDRNPQSFKKWHLSGFFERTHISFTKIFREVPKVARYVNFEDVNDFANYVYNPDFEIEMPGDEYYEKHILAENLSRFPKDFQNIGERYMIAVFRDAIKELRELAGKSNRIALPQWRPKQRQLQILLPLNLESSQELSKASVAIPIQTQGNLYVVKTVLPIHKAYSNARLLSKFTNNWLQPTIFDNTNYGDDYDE
ncbi:hypothetical protein PCC9214_03504 [Planktothrix tepida]|uniref:DUF3825 domain-containing protein n=2 Tax=Planktothrix TaxID=54304 RepID=A0A1J1LRM9_9CYAN|nr:MULTISPECIES: DUF3825 domain-containing protein [Planktothrix]CAD5944636.1 hypothetical protein NO713_02149 [Planktothrix pseudagardhii]CAD5966117.1 hypothetical protein PCC9214_03504 [Planktothrix tepida]CUR35055.1 conserved hypothetical protein [Planktothrix tepida PCC 9214]